MVPSDKQSYKFPTRPAKKTAQAKSRKRDVDLDMEQIIDALFPIWTEKRDPWEIAGHFALSPWGLKCSKEEWLMMDLPEFVARARKWVKDRAIWANHALSKYDTPERPRGERKLIGDLEHARQALPKARGRPIDQETWDIYRTFLDWCRENYAYPHGRIPKQFMMDNIEVLYPGWTDSSYKGRHAIEQGVRNAIKSARKFLELA